MRRSIAVAPGSIDWIVAGVSAAGASHTPVAEAEGLVWAGADAGDLAVTLEQNPSIRWVQLLTAGVENYREAISDDIVWTCAKGAHAQPVAERAVALLLALCHRLGEHTTDDVWTPRSYQALAERTIVVVGTGGIGTAVIDMLRPFGCQLVAVRRHPAPPLPGVRSAPVSALAAELSRCDAVILTVPLTPETEGVISRGVIRSLKPNAVLVNVGRGRLIDQQAVCDALESGAIAGVGLDVTDPEPLPDGHVLLTHPRSIVTSHSAASSPLSARLVQERVIANLERFVRGEPLLGRVDATTGY